MKTGKPFTAIAASILLLAVGTSRLQAESVYIPNASFESPETVFVDINTAPWQKGPTPAWYDESAGYSWSQLTGVFWNVPPEDEAHIDNCDGKQAVWLFAVPEAELYQDLEAAFEVGRCYELAVGVIGGGGNMRDNVPLEIRLYYRDANDVRVTIESTTFVYRTAGGHIKHFNDVRLALPVVRETDPWAGKNIGVQIVSTLTLADLDPTTGRAGGFWDLDNVRLTESLPLPAAPVSIPNGSFESPETVFVDVNIDAWQKGTKPIWYDESGGYTWSQLTGTFLNVPPEDEAHIDNCDGKQAVWLFAVPEAELYQDLEATFEVGRCYELAVGVIGGGGNMRDSVPLEIRLYYRDGNDVRVTIESTTFVYRTAGGHIKHFNDVRLALPVVRETDPWAGKNIGVQIVSTLTLADLDPTTGRAGGFWDLDNVRLTESLPPDDPAPTDTD